MITSAEISVRGRIITVPSIDVGGHTIVLSPGSLRIAEVKDEAWLPGDVVFGSFCVNVNRSAFRLASAIAATHTTPRYGYAIE